jgi:hypothetical protein
MRYTTKRNGKNVIPLLMAVCGIDLPYWRIDRADDLHSYLSGDAADKLAAYEDAEEQGRMVILPCKVGDKVLDKIADHIFTIQTVELGYKAGTLFRCGNPGTEDYMAFYDFEIGENIEILTRDEADAALKGETKDV